MVPDAVRDGSRAGKGPGWFRRRCGVGIALIACALLGACGNDDDAELRELASHPGETPAAKAAAWLDDPDPEHRKMALFMVAREPEIMRAEWARLHVLLDDEDVKVRQVALLLLPVAYPDKDVVRDLLLTRLRSHDPMRASEAALGLGLGELELAPRLPMLMAELRRGSDDPARLHVRRAIARLVGGLGPAASAQVPAMLELMETDASLAPAVVRALGRIVVKDGPHYDAVVSALNRADEDPTLWRAARDALRAIRHRKDDTESPEDE